jgi:hypothetical protein
MGKLMYSVDEREHHEHEEAGRAGHEEVTKRVSLSTKDPEQQHPDAAPVAQSQARCPYRQRGPATHSPRDISVLALQTLKNPRRSPD